MASPFMKKRLFSTTLRLNVDRKQTRREKVYLGSSGTKYLMTPQGAPGSLFYAQKLFFHLITFYSWPYKNSRGTKMHSGPQVLLRDHYSPLIIWLSPIFFLVLFAVTKIMIYGDIYPSKNVKIFAALYGRSSWLGIWNLSMPKKLWFQSNSYISPNSAL